MRTFYPFGGSATRMSKPFCLSLAFFLLTCFASTVSAQVLIKQIYAGGGTLGATLNASYVQIVNKSGSAVSLNGWSLQYESGKAKQMRVVKLPNVTLQPDQNFLIQGKIMQYGLSFPTNLISNMELDPTGGKVALMSNETALVSCPIGNYSGKNDLVGWGNTDCANSIALNTLSNTTIALRKNNTTMSSSNHSSFTYEVAAAPALSQSITLPIRLLEFSAKGVGGSNLLQWTADLTGASTFEVQRSANATDFSTIALLSADQAGSKRFSYSDNNASGSVQYYRLKMKDEAGVITHSIVVSVKGSSASALKATLAPTVTSSKVTLSLSSATTGTVQFFVMSVDGHILKSGSTTASASLTQLPLDVSSLSRGQYFLQVRNNSGQMQALKFIKQ